MRLRMCTKCQCFIGQHHVQSMPLVNQLLVTALSAALPGRIRRQNTTLQIRETERRSERVQAKHGAGNGFGSWPTRLLSGNARRKPSAQRLKPSAPGAAPPRGSLTPRHGRRQSTAASSGPRVQRSDVRPPSLARARGRGFCRRGFRKGRARRCQAHQDRPTASALRWPPYGSDPER